MTRDILGRNSWRLHGMWRQRNMRRCIAGTCAAAMLTCTAAAQAPNADSNLRDRPDPAAVSKAFTVVRDWVNEFETPRMSDDLSRVPLDGAMGVCVVLRRSGRVLGVGTDSGGDDLMLRRAVGLALNDVLSDPALASLSAKLRRQEVDDPDTPLTVDALRTELGKSILIELEVAGRLIPVIGGSIEQLARKFEPGLDGIGLRLRQQLNLNFPSQWRAINAGGDTGRLLLNAALSAGVSISEVNDLPRRDDVAFYRFRTTTLWQSSPEAAPIETVRGDVLVRQEVVDAARIAALADGIARHLMASMWRQLPILAGNAGPREPLGIMGDYSIVADLHRPLTAPPVNQALAALALIQYSRATAVGADAALAGEARIVARQILDDLAANEQTLTELSACAAVVYALANEPEWRQGPAINAMFLRASTRVNDSFDPASGFTEQIENENRRVNIAPHVQAMLAGATVRALSGGGSESAQRVRQAIDAAWRSVPQPQHVTLLPWIGWAERDFAAATRLPPAHADELRLLIEVLDRSMIDPARADDVTAAAYLGGGLALVTQDDSSGQPHATAQAVRPAAWLVGAAESPGLIPDDQLAEHHDRIRRICRFLVQLSVREELTGWLRNPKRALGGLRAALWDSDQPVPAQALGLLTAVEALRALWEQP